MHRVQLKFLLTCISDTYLPKAERALYKTTSSFRPLELPVGLRGERTIACFRSFHTAKLGDATSWSTHQYDQHIALPVLTWYVYMFAYVCAARCALLASIELPSIPTTSVLLRVLRARFEIFQSGEIDSLSLWCSRTVSLRGICRSHCRSCNTDSPRS